MALAFMIPEAGRYNQKTSSWDILHPGRSSAPKLQPGRKRDEILRALEAHLKPA